jgi:hypothetical protein
MGMKVRVTSVFLAIIFLWASSSLVAKPRFDSRTAQIKVTSQTLCVATAPGLAFEEQEFFPCLTPDPNCVRSAKADAAQYRAIIKTSSLHRSVKTYLLFRVLRN